MFIIMFLYGRRCDVVHERNNKFGLDRSVESANQSLDSPSSQQFDLLHYLKARQVDIG